MNKAEEIALERNAKMEEVLSHYSDETVKMARYYEGVLEDIIYYRKCNCNSSAAYLLKKYPDITEEMIELRSSLKKIYDEYSKAIYEAEEGEPMPKWLSDLFTEGEL